MFSHLVVKSSFQYVVFVCVCREGVEACVCANTAQDTSHEKTLVVVVTNACISQLVIV